MLRPVQLAAAAAAMVAAFALPVHAQSMFARTPSQYLGYGYGNFNWTEFTGLWDARFGAGNITQGNTIGSLAGYSALYLDANQPSTSAFNLSAAEQAEVLSFMANGGRVYAFGENSSWSSWNNNILGLFGAAAGGSASDFGTPVVNNLLTQGVTSINTPAPGAIGTLGPTGVSLFSNNIAATFGAAQNALVVLDINICDDGNINNADNRQFCRNIVDYTAGDPINPPSSVPEPGALALLGAGLVGLLTTRRRANRA